MIWSKRGYSPGIGQARPRPDPSWPRAEPVSGIEIYRRPDGGWLVHVAEGCRCRAIEFDGAIMELDGAGAYEFGGKEIIGFVC